MHELLHFFTHLEKGFLFTSVMMVKRPGKTVVDFIGGKRKIYQPPVSYFLIWIAIYGLLLYWIQHIFGESVVINYKQYFGPKPITQYAITHLAVVLTIVIPFQALYMHLLITKKNYYYLEAAIIAIYCLGTIIFFQFIFAIISLCLYAINKQPFNIAISDSFKIAYLIWFTIDFIRIFPTRDKKILKGVLFIILSFGTFTIWRLYGYPYVYRLIVH